ncbi:hypothetical protein BV25DRAFT_1993657 [Artomyces pyxidatus]|uniref:Uncharacterized protein n=1 Tax=Artomyces pyxidatus TaxID=48021 RepID=A0ACB8STB8_9AGAM|nr:hypothetical protein BV25DRAFT_1993657 [Artomyces pyxidatus]
MVEKVRANPVNLGSSNCYLVDTINRRYADKARQQDTVGSPTDPASPTFLTFPTITEADTLYSQLSNDSDALTVISPALISKFERTYWYHGISGNPPKLMWSSDFDTNPFPIPALGARFFKIPHKTAHGVFNTPLNAYSVLKTVRFSTVKDGEEEETFGQSLYGSRFVPTPPTPRLFTMPRPISLISWLTPRSPMSSSSAAVPYSASTTPSTLARQSDDAQGTLTILFREMKTSNGDPSDRILALTNKHVASVDTTTHYELDVANPQHILVCGERRLSRAVVEIEDAVNTGYRDAIRLSGEVEALKLKSGEKIVEALGRKQIALDAQNKDNTTLQALVDKIEALWQDTNNCRLGDVDWAPEISVRADDHTYTQERPRGRSWKELGSARGHTGAPRAPGIGWVPRVPHNNL